MWGRFPWLGSGPVAVLGTSSLCEGTGTAGLCLVLTAQGMQGIKQLQPTRWVFILAAQSGGSRYRILPSITGEVLPVTEQRALGAPVP